MNAAKVNSLMLNWARNRAGLTVADIAKHLGTKEHRVTAWESGCQKPTFKQAIKFAKKTNIPFGYLFLSQPPVDDRLPIPDLRTVSSQRKHKISPELMAIIGKMQSRQSWYREYLINLAASKNNAVGRFNLNSNVDEIVADLRRTLGVAVHPTKGDYTSYHKDLVRRIENAGILVMSQRFLRFNSNELSVDEFRGFALTDDYAPLIFINNADAPYARIFTLIHELAHLWIGEPGVSDTSIDNHRQEEVLCNAVAGEFLVDQAIFKQCWQTQCQPWHAQLDSLKKIFHVSNWVLARRALSLGLISKHDYKHYTHSLRQQYLNKPKKAGGGNFYNTHLNEISTPFYEVILNEVNSGKLLMRDGAELLNLNLSHLNHLKAATV